MYDLPTRDTRTFYLFKYVLLSFDLKPSFKICRLKLITIRQPNLGKDIYLFSAIRSWSQVNLAR